MSKLLDFSFFLFIPFLVRKTYYVKKVALLSMVAKMPKIKIMQNEEFALSETRIKIPILITNDVLFVYFYLKKIT